MNTKTDFLVIGAGIAGLSAAAELAMSAKVVVLRKGKATGHSCHWSFRCLFRTCLWQ